jgi:hypothetical protein
MVRKLGIILSVGALAAASFVTLAFASTGSINDPTGDTRHGTPDPAASYDIVKAGWGHTDSGKLKHWVVVDGTIGHPSTGRGSAPRLLINVPGQVADNPTCDYFIEAVPPHVIPNGTDHWKWYVKECSNGGSPEVTGPVAATRPTRHKIVLVFGKHAIGNPDHYGWQMTFPADGDAPPYDKAPNSGFKRHNL